ncbi:MAG: aminodeoxychorismate synthase component I [Pedosphaera sp.]|nr:aminodeoxychorismate synthase component I [Pedosphaera sp.]
MRATIQEFESEHSPDSLAASLRGESGVVLLRTRTFDAPSSRYSLVAARPFLTFRSFGSRCETQRESGLLCTQFGDPWRLLGSLLASFELMDELDHPFPLGGCFGYWGYELNQFVEPRLARRAINDLELPDCHLGFYDSLVLFDHQASKTWVIATGLAPDGSRNAEQSRRQLHFWRDRLVTSPPAPGAPSPVHALPAIVSSLSRVEFLSAVRRAQRYICQGDIYQVNLAQRFASPCPTDPWMYYEHLSAASPSPFSAWIDCGDFQLASSSPELFLRLSGSHVLTRPIKGTRPRSADPDEDARFTHELLRSEKEMAELVMITDLLRNDLGRVCEYGSVTVPELVRLERYHHVQHLVSTIEGRLRPEVTHLEAMASCFPGGSITGAPKIRAMEIIDELEPVTRGPYCGAHGYLGFNRESQLSITIRTAVLRHGHVWFHSGAGIVADSVPEAEYDETMAKAGGLLAALSMAPASQPAR